MYILSIYLNNDLNKNYTLANSVTAISSYTSTSNYFVCPSDGYLRGALTASSNAPLQIGVVDNKGTSTSVNTQFMYMVSGRVDVKMQFVKKGTKLYVVSRPTTGAEAPSFIPLASY